MLRANPALVESLVPEIIRWQTPLACHAPHRANRYGVGGQTDHNGDKLGYVVSVGQPR